MAQVVLQHSSEARPHLPKAGLLRKQQLREQPQLLAQRPIVGFRTEPRGRVSAGLVRGHRAKGLTLVQVKRAPRRAGLEAETDQFLALIRAALGQGDL